MLEEPVTINILGQRLLVKTLGDDESLKLAAARLEEKIEKLTESGVTADTLRLLMYAAIQLAGENIKMEEDLANLGNEVDLASSRMLKIIDLE